MELREIVTFLQVAQQKSFSKAAHRLGYSQAAVTIQIRQLEEELQVHLFDRIGKRTTLTYQGTVFYDYAVRVVQNLEQAKDAIAGTMELTGRLCIGTVESICSSIFPGLLKTYHDSYPHVDIKIVTDTPGKLLDMMEHNAIDMVYILDERVYDNKWVKILEEPEQVVFVAPSGNPLASVKKLSIDEVIRHPFLLTEKDVSYRHSLEQFLAAQGKEIHPFLEIGNTDFIIRQLGSHEGISFLPEFTVRSEIEQGKLSVLQVENFSMKIWRQIIYHKDKWVTREMRAFMDLAR